VADGAGIATVVEVRGPNAVGALYHIAHALAERDLDIRHAKVLTLGHSIVDSFYVVDRGGRKLDRGSAEEVRRSVGRAVADLVP
jgi:[protein-PII] uridylyltransferase